MGVGTVQGIGANRRPDGGPVDDRVTVTLHVYGGEMKHCHLFEPNDDGSFRRVGRDLVLND